MSYRVINCRICGKAFVAWSGEWVGTSACDSCVSKGHMP